MDIAAKLRLHNAWRRGEGVFDGVTPAPMPHTPKELGDIIEAAAVNCERMKIMEDALVAIKNIKTGDCVKYVALADNIACEALARLENE